MEKVENVRQCSAIQDLDTMMHPLKVSPLEEQKSSLTQ